MTVNHRIDNFYEIVRKMHEAKHILEDARS